MKALLVSILTAAIAGVGAGRFMNMSDDVLPLQPPAKTAAASHAPVSEDPGLALHRVAMGSDAWTAPQPATPSAFVAADPLDLDAIEARLAAVQAEAHEKGDAARGAYARLFGADADPEQDAPSPDVAAISLPR